jgi:hypothetical protein
MKQWNLAPIWVHFSLKWKPKGRHNDLSLQWKRSGGVGRWATIYASENVFGAAEIVNRSAAVAEWMAGQWKVSYRVDWNEPINFVRENKKFKFRVSRHRTDPVNLMEFFSVSNIPLTSGNKKENRRPSSSWAVEPSFFGALTVRPKTERSGLFFPSGPSTVFFYIWTKPSVGFVQLLSDRTLFDAPVIYFKRRPPEKSSDVLGCCFSRPIKCRPWFEF